MTMSWDCTISRAGIMILQLVDLLMRMGIFPLDGDYWDITCLPIVTITPSYILMIVAQDPLHTAKTEKNQKKHANGPMHI